MSENETALALSEAGLPMDMEDLFDSIDKSRQAAPAPVGGVDFLKFDSKVSGNWTFGREESEIGDARLGLQLRTLEHGYLAWHNKEAKRHGMVPLAAPRPNLADLEDPKSWGEQTSGPNKGKFSYYQDTYSAKFEILDGKHAGTVVHFDGASKGGYGMMVELRDAVFAQRGRGGGYVIPIFKLSGTPPKGDNKVRYPILDIIDYVNARGESRLEAPQITAATEADDSDGAVDVTPEEPDIKAVEEESGRRRKFK